MRPPLIHFLIQSRLLTGLAIIYAIVGLVEIRTLFHSVTYNREVFPEKATEPLGGERPVEYSFVAEHSALKGLWVFFDVPPDGPSETILTLTLLRAADRFPIWSESFECRTSLFIARAQLFRPRALALKEGERYVFTYAFPDLKPADGWRMNYCLTDNRTSALKWDGQSYPCAEPSMCWLGRELRFPARTLIAGAALLGLCSMGARSGTSFRIPALIILPITCVISATWFWQQHLWQFWGNFWPDGYPALSYKLYSLFTGRIPFQDCLTYFRHDRCAQAFFVPLVMAIFQTCGLSIKASYLATNTLSFAVIIATFLGLIRIYRLTNDRSIIAIGLLFFGHRCLIGAVGEFQTDLAGIAATLFYVYALSRALLAEKRPEQLVWYCVWGFAGFLACTVRIALVSLPLIPACLFIWSLFCERQRAWRERTEYLIPTLVAIALLWACWWLPGLWGTLGADWVIVLQNMQFFTWGGFFITTLLAMQFSLVVLWMSRRELFKDRVFAALAGASFSLLVVLAYTLGPTWLRYWDPPATIGLALCIWALGRWPAKEGVFLMVGWISLLLNLVIP
jgi:hypothetical protein